MHKCAVEVEVVQMLSSRTNGDGQTDNRWRQGQGQVLRGSASKNQCFNSVNFVLHYDIAHS